MLVLMSAVNQGFSWRAQPPLPWPFYAAIVIGVFLLGIGVGMWSTPAIVGGAAIVVCSVFSGFWYFGRTRPVAPASG